MTGLDREAVHLSKASVLSRIARAVYADDARADFPFLGESFEKIITLRGERVFGLVVSDSQHVVMTFRGKDDDRQLAEFLAYSQTEWIEGRAHGGFVKLLNSVWERVLAALYDAKVDGKTLWLTGHSLGGSLAILAAQRLVHEGFEPYLVVTFGSPRVLDPEAAQAFRVPLYRVINNEDAVPRLLWPTLFDTYADAGEEVFLLASGDVAEARHSTHLARKLDRANHIGEGVLPAGPVHDHAIEEYLAKLGCYAKSS